MKRLTIAILAVLLAPWNTHAQELFVYSEPASNMPAHSVGIRINNLLMDETGTGHINYHLIPEIMWGANKNLMIHVEGFISNRSSALQAEGVGIYAKYRIYSKDAVQRHFRMAVFARASTNNAPIHQEEIMTNGHNSGYMLGAIATQLLHKQAISATLSYEHALDNFGGNEYPTDQSREAINYALATGRLFYPKHYTGYKQTNINGLLEVLGQSLVGTNKMYLDIAPAIQFIFNSQTRVDIGYRHEIYSNMQRTAPNGFLVRVEHTFFNIGQ